MQKLLRYDETYKNSLFTQKQEGYSCVYVHPEGGSLETKNLQNILNFVSKLDYRRICKTC